VPEEKTGVGRQEAIIELTKWGRDERKTKEESFLCGVRVRGGEKGARVTDNGTVSLNACYDTRGRHLSRKKKWE